VAALIPEPADSSKILKEPLKWEDPSKQWKNATLGNNFF
jgi:hypothetical protein